MNTDLTRAVLRGGIGFCLVSLVVFATVAYGERWMYARLGVVGAYVAWTLAFVLLGGLRFAPRRSSGLRFTKR